MEDLEFVAMSHDERSSWKCCRTLACPYLRIRRRLSSCKCWRKHGNVVHHRSPPMVIGAAGQTSAQAGFFDTLTSWWLKTATSSARSTARVKHHGSASGNADDFSARQKASWRLKMRLLKTGAVETFFY